MSNDTLKAKRGKKPTIDFAVVYQEDTDACTEANKPSIANNIAENMLAMYFKEMAALSIFTADEELTRAQNIKRIDIGLWTQLLRYLPLQNFILSLIETNVKLVSGVFSALCDQTAIIRHSPSSDTCAQFNSLSTDAAMAVHKADADRKALVVVIKELKKAHSDKSNANGTTQIVYNEFFKRTMALFNASQRLRNEFVQGNLRLVVSIAKRFNFGRMPLDDLIQEGNLGLIKAVDRYDYSKGYRFSTYACWWVRHAISRALADKGRSIRLPVHLLDTSNHVNRAIRSLTAKLDRMPSLEEISNETGLAVDKIEKVQEYIIDQQISLDQDPYGTDDNKFAEMLEAPNFISPIEKIAECVINANMHDIIKDLKPIEIDVLRKRFGLFGSEEQTLKAIGNGYTLSRERIRQIQEEALSKIRYALEERQLLVPNE